MSFFVTSTGSGAAGGNLGGLAGADAKCQTLATGAGAGGKTWRASLSITGTDARSRIGAGPWFNQKGKMIAANVAGLHAADILAADIFDEKGAAIPLVEHDLLTGSAADGTASANLSCTNWTSNANADMCTVGHSDSTTSGNPTDRWNNAHPVRCTSAAFTGANGAGRFACFATN